MKPEELLGQALGIEAPWQVIRVRNDLGKRQIDVWVAPASQRTGWFFGSKATVDTSREQVWRHINLGNARCLIHAVPPPAAQGEPPAWCGDGELPFTRAMSRLIASMLREGVKLQSICTLLDVTIADLWKFKHNLDSGKASLTAPSIAPALTSSVPEADDPVWERLLDGSLNIDIRMLSLKLLLTKLRDQMRVITDPEVRVLKSYEIQRYFARYEQALGHELGQLQQR